MGVNGERIRAFRKKKNLSQTELGQRAKVGKKQAVAAIEAGRVNPTIKRLEKIAKELGVSIKELLD